MRLTFVAALIALFALPLSADCPMSSAACGQTINRSLTASCETEGYYVQFHRFSVSARTSLTITAQSAAFSPVLVVYDSDAKMIGGGSAAQGSAARAATVVGPGVYTVAVRALEKGAYSLAIGCANP
jgi:hypothetical protein